MADLIWVAYARRVGQGQFVNAHCQELPAHAHDVPLIDVTLIGAAKSALSAGADCHAPGVCRDLLGDNHPAITLRLRGKNIPFANGCGQKTPEQFDRGGVNKM